MTGPVQAVRAWRRERRYRVSLAEIVARRDSAGVYRCGGCAADNAENFPWPELGYPVSRLAARSVFVHCRDCRRPI